MNHQAQITILQAIANARSEILANHLPQAEEWCSHILQADPRNSEAWNILGVIAMRTKKPEIAVELFANAVRSNEVHADAVNNLGVALRALGQREEAEASYRTALTIRPHFAEAQHNLGVLLQEIGRREEAEASYQRALAINPDFSEAHYDLGVLLQEAGRCEEAEVSYRRALAIKPDYVKAFNQWVHIRQHLAAWDNLQAHTISIRELVESRYSKEIIPFTLLCLPDTEPREHLECARQYVENQLETYLQRQPLFRARRISADGRLRVGYLSADFHDHATSRLLADVIEQHDRNHFEILGYSYGPDDASPLRRRMSAAFDRFVDLRALGDLAAAQRIADDNVDILIDLKGYTTRARLVIAALRPAAIQVNWLGYPGTLGHLRLADYIVGDPIVSPIEHAAHFSEALALMPHCYQPNDRRRTIGPKPSRAESGLPEKGFIFASLNQSYKLTPRMFDLWCGLLREVPGSILWLMDLEGAGRVNLIREAAARGIGKERIVFAPVTTLERHLGRLQLADLALDTFPVTSHTTASDALWSGVPHISMIGDSFVSRVAASVLHAAGLAELVCRAPEQYAALALALARDPGRLKALRARLAAQRLSCPLFDSERFTRDLERLYERMWSNHQAGKHEHIILTRDSPDDIAQ